MSRFVDFFAGPTFDRKFHGGMTLVFLALILPSVIWWKDSIPYLVFLSVYANLAGHYSAWQAAKTEGRLEDQGVI